MGVIRTTLPELVTHDYRLGRHIAHDSRSWDYPAVQADLLRSVTHDLPASLPLDQGDVGSCTGNAMAGLLGCHGVVVNEDLAVSLYSEATHLDRYRGIYPPTDTGSAGLFVAKAARRRGLCKDYRHAFGLAHALHALVVAPVIIGINWYDSFDQPTGPYGLISITPGARPRGGHEVLVYGIDVENRRVLVMNSWGRSYGVRGAVRLSWADLDRLLQEKGDVTTVGF